MPFYLGIIHGRFVILSVQRGGWGIYLRAYNPFFFEIPNMQFGMRICVFVCVYYYEQKKKDVLLGNVPRNCQQSIFIFFSHVSHLIFSFFVVVFLVLRLNVKNHLQKIVREKNVGLYRKDGNWVKFRELDFPQGRHYHGAVLCIWAKKIK